MPTGASLAVDPALRGADAARLCDSHAKHGRWAQLVERRAFASNQDLLNAL